MKRREFIRFVGGAAFSWPLAVRAQQSVLPVVGFLNSTSPHSHPPSVAAFRDGLNLLGYVEGQNVTIEYRWAEGNHDPLPAMAADLVQRKVTMIAAITTPAALAAKAATTTIPIVFETADDPITLGLVASLSRPGGNLTGITLLNSERVVNRLGLLHDLIPSAKIVGLLVNPKDPGTEAQSKGLQESAHAIGLQVQILNATNENEIDAAFADLVQLRANALIVGTGEPFDSRAEQLTTMAARYRVPAMYQLRRYATAGGLISYGASLTDPYYLAGVYSGRILKGAKPADLPVQESKKMDLIINLTAAKMLGLTVPPVLLAIADEVIE